MIGFFFFLRKPFKCHNWTKENYLRIILIQHHPDDINFNIANLHLNLGKWFIYSEKLPLSSFTTLDSFKPECVKRSTKMRLICQPSISTGSAPMDSTTAGRKYSKEESYVVADVVRSTMLGSVGVQLFSLSLFPKQYRITLFT